MSPLRDFLLAPPGTAVVESGRAERPPVVPARRRAARAAVPRAVALLSCTEDARALAVAAAVLLARRGGVGCGLACVWTAGAPPRHPEAGAPAARASRRLAAALGARDLDARAHGRAAVVTLPADPADAVVAAGRAGAAAGDAPAVLVLGGPRSEAFDPLLAGQERVLVLADPERDPALAALALEGLPPGAGFAAAGVVGLGPVTRALATAGLVVPGPLRRAFDGAAG